MNRTHGVREIEIRQSDLEALRAYQAALSHADVANTAVASSMELYARKRADLLDLEIVAAAEAAAFQEWRKSLDPVYVSPTDYLAAKDEAVESRVRLYTHIFGDQATRWDLRQPIKFLDEDEDNPIASLRAAEQHRLENWWGYHVAARAELLKRLDPLETAALYDLERVYKAAEARASQLYKQLREAEIWAKESRGREIREQQEASQRAEEAVAVARRELNRLRAILAVEQKAASETTERVKHSFAALTEYLKSLPSQTLQQICSVDVIRPVITQLPFQEVSSPIEAGIVRGELQYSGRTCNQAGVARDLTGHLLSEHTSDDGETIVRVRWDRLGRDPLVESRDTFDRSFIDSVIPPSHNPINHPELQLHSMVPWVSSPVDQDAQAEFIKTMQCRSGGLRGWLMVGPPGASKTAWVSSYLTDVITARVPNRRHFDLATNPHNLGVYRLKLNRWLSDNLEWTSRDFNDRDVKRPAVTIDLIEEVAQRSGFPPILWLEEVDKITPSKNRSDLLNSLVDAVYEQEGCIIVTSNDTVEALTKKLGEPTLRRITGRNDDPERYSLWDLFAHLKKNSFGRPRT